MRCCCDSDYRRPGRTSNVGRVSSERARTERHWNHHGMYKEVRQRRRRSTGRRAGMSLLYTSANASCWHCLRSMRRGLCNGTVCIRPSVCLFIYRPLQQRAAGLLLWTRRPGNIDRLLHGRRSAANVTFSADVASWKDILVFVLDDF